MVNNRVSIREISMGNNTSINDDGAQFAGTDREVFEGLTAKFPETDVRQRSGGGRKTFKYLPEPVVRNRLNEVLGLNWNWEVISENESEFKGKSCIVVCGKLSIFLPSGKEVIRTGHGGSLLDNGNAAGDAYKAASSNALKKAAYLMGIGSYFGLESEESQDDTSGWGAPQAAPASQGWGGNSSPQPSNSPAGDGGWGPSGGSAGGGWGN